MKKGGKIHGLLQLAFFLGGMTAGSASFALDSVPVIPSVPPGSYAEPQVISFSHPQGTRLSLFMDGKEITSADASVLLSVPENTEKDFTIKTELRSLLPGAPVLFSAEFVWRIDRKKPEKPVITARRLEGGSEFLFTLNEPGKIYYQIFHPEFASFSSGSVISGSTLFVPDGSYICAYGADLAGNTGPAVSPAVDVISSQGSPYQILNPVPGNWANYQVLLIKAMPEMQIYYSIDGSDPSISGIVYTGPVLIEQDGMVSLRVLVVDKGGNRYTSQVRYSVSPQGSPVISGLNTDSPVIETGEFAEIFIPENYTFSFGDAVPGSPGGRALLFTAVRGVRWFFPLTLSDGKSVWRWICASGISTEAGTGTDIAGNNEDSIQPVIYNWYFAGFDYNGPVYYALNDTDWQIYTNPFFLDRSKESELKWYSPVLNNAEVQTVRLPVKPGLTGVPPLLITADPVFLSIPNSPYTFYYTGGNSFYPSLPDPLSPQLASGILVEIPSGMSEDFFFRILAEYDGLVHGEINSRFIIDRKPPRTPSSGIDAGLTYSRSPVAFSPTGEDTIQLTIQPPLFVQEGKSFVLHGDISGPIEYKIELFGIDRVGNRSPVVSQKVTVDLNALYVDSSFSGRSNGTPLAPYTSLDDALNVIRGVDEWRIYITGETEMNRQHTIQNDIQIFGTDAVVKMGENASFTILASNISVSDCTFSQTAGSSSRSASMAYNNPAALFELQNSSLSMNNVQIERSGLPSASIIRSVSSVLVCSNTGISLSASEYGQLIDARYSGVTLNNCRLSITASDASALVLTGSETELKNTIFTVTPGSAGRAIESWNSQIDVRNVSFVRKTNRPIQRNRDTAFWFDSASTVVFGSNILVEGFEFFTPGKKYEP
ncbi:chitobiase/beta-hexosaminidase C-terminal domain-containing protein [Brucepastera parasyntrophica]|uniref:FN3 associated domain-containing protein n=1 Tax=Brucepastera parasyntrophica TaxID=2880008 RepID=UPI00210D0C5A|nr:FN3 associated domain-containing protein [Brucepastera parasyntrophica]ULQ59647.1 chitobiase/beta-hexosaminidase C-terminal domain-containing protein [Brucepastera parasyntrophica]